MLFYPCPSDVVQIYETENKLLTESVFQFSNEGNHTVSGLMIWRNGKKSKSGVQNPNRCEVTFWIKKSREVKCLRGPQLEKMLEYHIRPIKQYCGFISKNQIIVFCLTFGRISRIIKNKDFWWWRRPHKHFRRATCGPWTVCLKPLM